MKRSFLQVQHLLGLLLLAVGGCISPPPSVQTLPTPTVLPTVTAETAVFPDVLDAQLTRNADGSFNIAVTISSPYDTPQQYADGWRVLAPDGTVLGEHTLLHDHANEQPFTRTQRGVIIPSDVLSVTVEGRDLVNGYGGSAVTLAVEHPAE
jgi:hypothetical protein